MRTSILLHLSIRKHSTTIRIQDLSRLNVADTSTTLSDDSLIMFLPLGQRWRQGTLLPSEDVVDISSDCKQQAYDKDSDVDGKSAFVQWAVVATKDLRTVDTSDVTAHDGPKQALVVLQQNDRGSLYIVIARALSSESVQVSDIQVMLSG